MLLRMFLAIVSIFTPFVGLVGGLYYKGVFKKTVVKRPTFAIFLMVLSIPITLLFVLVIFAPTSNQEVATDVTPSPIYTRQPTYTPVPKPTATPVPDPTPIVHEFSGTSDRVLGPIKLEPGVLVLVADHKGQSNFIVKIVGESGISELSINTIGPYSGARAHTVSSRSAFQDLVSGTHRIQVQAEGAWSLKLEQTIPPRGITATPEWETRTPDNVFRWLSLPKGQYVLTASHDGNSNFIIQLLASDGSAKELLVNTIGAYSGENLIQVGSNFLSLTPGFYALVVQADGSWAVDIN